MNRLVQGDVGAGKTVVALRAMLQVVDARPAGRAARAHRGARRPARPLAARAARPARAGRRAGRGRAGHAGHAAHRVAAAPRPSGRRCWTRSPARPGIVVGTHALIQDRVGFADLGLVVVDEQHRFGVEQRDALRGRGELAPHVLVMTATPIPRTVAMTVYGDLEVSALRELPGGRSPIATTVVPLAEKPAWLERVWQRVREEVAAGHQAYVVCPRVGGDAGQADDGARRPTRTTTRRDGRAPRRRSRCSTWRRSWPRAPLAGPADRRAARQAAGRREGRRDAGVRARRARRAGGHHRDRGRRRRAQRHRHGDPGRRPVRPVPAAPAARPGRPRLGARGVPAGHRHARRAPPPASGSTRWPAPPTASSWPGSTWSCAGRATCWARRSPGAAPGCGCCRCCATRRSSRRRGCYATDIVADDPGLRAPPRAGRAGRRDRRRRGARGLPRQGLTRLGSARPAAVRSTALGRRAPRPRGVSGERRRARRPGRPSGGTWITPARSSLASSERARA